MTQPLAFVIKRLQDKDFFGGGERISFNLIRTLCQRGILVDVYCQETNINEDYKINKIIFIDKNEDLNRKAAKLTKNKDYKHIFTENLETPIDICMAHGHSVLYRQIKARTVLDRLINRILKGSKLNFINYQKRNLHGNNLVIVPSKVCKQDYSEYLKYDPSKIKVIYPGVDIPEKIQSKEENPIFIFGLSAPGFSNKGGYLFLKALFLLKISGYKFKAKIIYPGYNNNLLVKVLVFLSGLKNRIEFVGHQKDMQYFYNSIDCMVIPSKLETFGMVILESIANKIPVIVSSRCGSAEILQDRQNGYIFNYDKFQTFSLFNKMSFVLSNKSKLNNIVQNGFNTAQTYNWNRYCDEFIEAITNL